VAAATIATVWACVCVCHKDKGVLAISITCFLPTGMMHVMGGVLGVFT
jgi:hypothetical protein